MAVRGRKPKAPVLKLVTGNPGKRPIQGGSEIQIREGSLRPPKKLKKPQRDLWSRFIDTAWWLTDHDVPKAYIWVCLQAEHDKDPAVMVAARVAQLRVLGSELGLDPGSRARMGVTDGQKEDPADKFFTR